VFILDALAGYNASNATDAEASVERVTPRLQHANCAVVLSAVKVVLKQLPLLVGNTELLAGLRKKLAPPLVTLLSAEPEIQYVALRNINLIIQRYPAILGCVVFFAMPRSLAVTCSLGVLTWHALRCHRAATRSRSSSARCGDASFIRLFVLACIPAPRHHASDSDLCVRPPRSTTTRCT
jgi:hypothetical protein